jgi:3-oxoacyl-(acyl-carrier-protein) synthase III
MTLLKTAKSTSHAGLIGLGVYRPERVVPNAELVEAIDSSDEWIRERSGIIERRFARSDETAASMGAMAAAQALTDAGLAAKDIDVVLVATFSHRYQTPSAAAEIAAEIGADNASAFDISAACAGFCYGIGIADSLVRAGTAKNVLVIGTEKLSDIINFSDRGTAFIFADGAGAVIVSETKTQGIGPTVWGADGNARETIIMQPDSVTASKQGVPSLLTMQGQAVFRWAVGSMADVCTESLAASGLPITELKAFVPHQANTRITDAIVKRLDFPKEIVVSRDIETAGNTSAASIPLALHALRESGQVKKGDTFLMVGFGAGLAYASQVALVP